MDLRKKRVISIANVITIDALAKLLKTGTDNIRNTYISKLTIFKLDGEVDKKKSSPLILCDEKLKSLFVSLMFIKKDKFEGEDLIKQFEKEYDFIKEIKI